MNKFKLVLKYKHGNKTIETSVYENEHFFIEQDIKGNFLKLSIKPKEKLHLVSCKIIYQREYLPDDRFFMNGYQSWTTSKEVGHRDEIKGYLKLSHISRKMKEVTKAPGDYYIVDYPKEPGIFHSFTYTYLRNEEKVNFCGSLNERTGYTIFRANMPSNIFEVIKDVEGVTIDSEYELLNIVFIKGSYDEVFDKYFEILNLEKPRINFLSGYTSWYNYFQKIDENIILRDLEGMALVKEHSNIFQIDDGYAPAVGDWLLPSDKFPNGMKYVAQQIHDKNLLAGIWLAPFNAQKKSQIVKDHPEWFLKNEKGQLAYGVVAWGGAYILDLENPAVKEHLRNVFDVVLNDWGFDMVKLDFLYSQCIMPRNGKSRGQIMCEAMDFLRECVGEKLILGCGVPLGPAFGKVDACRISCDVDLSFKPKIYGRIHVVNEMISTKNAMTNSIFRRHLDGRVFCNDPDVMFFRDHNLRFTNEQKDMLSIINNMFGNVLFVSDDIGRYDEASLEKIKNCFTKKDFEIISAEYIEEDLVKVKYNLDDNTHVINFDLKTGRMT